MALIKCPECGNSISDKAEKCPYCGLPAAHFFSQFTPADGENVDIDYRGLSNILLPFEHDYTHIFCVEHYISHPDKEYLENTYKAY